MLKYIVGLGDGGRGEGKGGVRLRVVRAGCGIFGWGCGWEGLGVGWEEGKVSW